MLTSRRRPVNRKGRQLSPVVGLSAGRGRGAVRGPAKPPSAYRIPCRAPSPVVVSWQPGDQRRGGGMEKDQKLQVLNTKEGSRRGLSRRGMVQRLGSGGGAGNAGMGSPPGGAAPPTPRKPADEFPPPEERPQ